MPYLSREGVDIYVEMGEKGLQVLPDLVHIGRPHPYWHGHIGIYGCRGGLVVTFILERGVRMRIQMVVFLARGLNRESVKSLKL